MKHYFEYIVFILLVRLLKMLSINQSANFCSMLARKIGPFTSFTKIARQNLKNVYGDSIDMNKSINDIWDNFGRYIGEFPLINQLSPAELIERVTFVGLQNIHNFQKNHQPFIMFLGHLANWDILLARINVLYPQFVVVYRKANNPIIDQLILINRQQYSHNIQMIAKGFLGAKSLVSAIKSKMSIVMLVDQKMNNGIEIPFFGRPAMTASAIARLALKYNYPIIPCQIIRNGRSSHFEIRIHSPLKTTDCTGDIQQDCVSIMTRINLLLEQWIREHPCQWFWFHNRWKD